MNVVFHFTASLMVLLISHSEQTCTSTSDCVSTEAPNSEICLTKGCVIAAAAVLQRMNESIDPCDNFYEFACGTFLEETFIPDEKVLVSPITQIGDDQGFKLKKIFEEEISEDSDSAVAILIKNLYNSCLDIESINAKGFKHILEIINESFGGWPVLLGSSWNEVNFSWIEAMYTSRSIGLPISTIFDFGVFASYANSSQRIVWVDSPSFYISREYLIKGLNDSIVQAYLQYSIDVAILMGADPSEAEEEMKDVLEFQIELAKITLSQEDRRVEKNLNNIKTIQELQTLVPEIPWLEYINAMLPGNLVVSETEEINIGDIGYITNFTQILENTPERVIANYIIWRIIAGTVPYLSSDIRELEFELLKVMRGLTSRPPRWKECVDLVSKSLVFATDNLYIKNYFDEDSKQQVEEIVLDVKEAFEEILNNTEWMAPETKEEALIKLDAMKAFVAYADEIVNDAIIADFYSELAIDAETLLLLNMFNFSKFYLDYTTSLLREKINGSHWTQRPAAHVINARYNPSINAMEFLAGILQGHVFQPDRPKYMNFAAIGSIIGHEITHGFDDQGRQFDEDGNIRNWWDNITEKNFLERAKCIIDQYNKFKDPETGLNLNGNNTQGENIADNGGTKVAYKAYGRWVNKYGTEDRLPGMNYTANQVFWISDAQLYCQKSRQEYLRALILTNVHSPGRFRVIGPLSNSEDFAKDFKCSSGSNMNPTDKCAVW